MMEMQKKKPGLRAFHDIPDRHLIGSISCVFFAGAGRFLFGFLWLLGCFLFGILSAQNLIGDTARDVTAQVLLSGSRLTVPGELMQSVGAQRSAENEIPAIVLQLQE